MLIQRMSAVFGRLRNETLQLQDGLNIIEAPNETGKSTWCAFLTAMLYGINSRERDKAGFIADKNRYAPWDGSSMSGRLECHADGADLYLENPWHIGDGEKEGVRCLYLILLRKPY